MTERLLNKYLKVQPLTHSSFVSSEKTSYEELAKVLAKDDSITDIEIGDTVRFDSFMVKKYPVEGDDGKFDWYISYDEIVSASHA